MVAGVTSVGADAILLGVLPTPAVAYLTKRYSADAGVMISASHNPVEDNGIKFFSGSGFKLSDQLEDEIEGYIATDTLPRPIGEHLGRVFHEPAGIDHYIEFLTATIGVDLSGLHVALDCAHGAASEVAPEVLRRLGAKVTVAYNEPDGVNINVMCGSTHPSVIQKLVTDCGADVGISHDGDADRVMAVDHLGNLVDGDHILAICGLDLLNKGRLPHGRIAATIYSNGGLSQVFQEAGGGVVLTSAGDRYVLEAMVEQGLVLGGEQSGHIIFLEHNSTGDGVLTALKLLEVMVSQGVPLAELAQKMPVFPQILVNVKVATKEGWDENTKIREAIAQAESKLGAQGRIFVRSSGTEPVIRVMGEHPDRKVVEEVVRSVADTVWSEQGA